MNYLSRADGELVVVSAAIEPSAKQALIERARDGERSLSSEIRLIVRQALVQSAESGDKAS